MARAPRWSLLTLLLSSVPGLALAHGREARHVELTLDENTVDLAFSPSFAAVSFADDDGSGALDEAEVTANREAIRRRLTEGIHLHAGGETPRVERSSVSFAAPHQGDVESAGVAFSLRASFASAPSGMSLQIALPFDGSRTLFASRIAMSERPGVWTLQERTSREVRSGDVALLFSAALTSNEPAPRPAAPAPVPVVSDRGVVVAAAFCALFLVLLAFSMVRSWRRGSKLLEVRL